MAVRAVSRTAALVLALVVVGGCGGPAGPVSPFTRLGTTETHGWPVLGVGPPGVTLRFIPDTPFAVGIVLRNRSRRTLTIVGIRTRELPRTLVRQVAVGVVPYRPPRCGGRHSCLFAGFPLAGPPAARRLP